MSLKKIAVLQHSQWEGPGIYMVEAAEKTGVELNIVKCWEEQYPDPMSFSGFIVLGGGANVNEEDKYPFLVSEKKYIHEIMLTERPCLGICLGHQLMADALGAKIGKNPEVSIGAGQAQLTPEGIRHPLFENSEKTFPTFKWHGQAVLLPLPDNFEILAFSDVCQVEAFSIKDRPHIIGVQYDNHAAHPDDVAFWYDQDKDWIESFEYLKISRSSLIYEMKGIAEKLRLDFVEHFEAFCRLCS